MEFYNIKNCDSDIALHNAKISNEDTNCILLSKDLRDFSTFNFHEQPEDEIILYKFVENAEWNKLHLDFIVKSDK